MTPENSRKRETKNGEVRTRNNPPNTHPRSMEHTDSNIARKRALQRCVNMRKRRQRVIRIKLACILIFLFTILGTGYFIINTINQTPLVAENHSHEFTLVENLDSIILGLQEYSNSQIATYYGVNTATEENHKTNGLAICMYHYVYQKDNPPDNLNNNYIEQDALRKEFEYLVENEYYFPTWEEVRKYVDGDLLLPEKSVVLTFDDAAKSFLTLGIPVAEEFSIPITSFIITKNDGAATIEKYDSPYVVWESHTHDMHRAGGSIGHGGIFTAMSLEAATNDLLTSIEICGSGDALAYPYGDYNDSSVQAVKDADFLCAVTTNYGRVYPGDDPYLLNRVRMLEGQSLASFIVKVE